MRGQWGLVLTLVFAFIVAVFALINGEKVSIHYLFGTARLSLVLVILGSALLGGLGAASFSLYRMFQLKRKIRRLEAEVAALSNQKGETKGKKEEKGMGGQKNETEQTEASQPQEKQASREETLR